MAVLSVIVLIFGVSSRDWGGMLLGGGMLLFFAGGAAVLAANKYLSTVLLHRVAQRYEALGLATRFAAITSDSSIYLTRIKRGAIAEIETALAREQESYDRMAWVDDAEFAYEAG